MLDLKLKFKKENTALIIVDMQNDFVREGAPMEVSDARGTIAPISELINMARKNKMPVIFTKFVAGPKRTLLWNWSSAIPENCSCFRNYKRSYKDIAGERECADVIDELYPLAEDYVIEKYGYSAFRNTNLIDILRANDCDGIIVTGTVTQICVGDTVHDAFHEGLKVIVASDCVSSFSELQQKATIENFKQKYGDVTDSKRIIEMFS